MKYRTFGRLDWSVSVLGFGAMRLPVIDQDNSKIDEPEATRMLRYAIDAGVNYVDTAYPYHRGTSEGLVGRALQDGYRQRVRLATKMPVWLMEKHEDLDRYLDEQLERLQTESIDFYLLHALNAKNWPKIRDLGVLSWAERTMADGRFHHLGFSFHDTYEVFQEIVDAYDGWTFCQIQYNYMDEEYQAGTRGLQYAAGKGLAVVVMEPIRGGQLSDSPPQAIQDLWDTAAHKRTPAEWALQWVWNHPEVSVVLSGMSTMEHVRENVASADRSAGNSLSDGELALIARVRDRYRELCPIPCTDCGYCQPCPEGVFIPRIFETYNEGVMYNIPERVKRLYNSDWWLKPEQRADQCVQCGECEEKCPQNIAIIEWLERVHQALADGETP
jgi:predicted aldo/keto reductase-like oxidoreductase